MTWIVVTGAIGAGKSTLSNALSRLGAAVFDADACVRELYATRPELLDEVGQLLGLDSQSFERAELRAAVAARLFADSEGRARVEGLIHPLVWAAWQEFRAAHPQEMLVYDVPVYRSKRVGEPDLVVLVTAPAAVRRERLRARGWTDSEIEQRMLVQEQTLPEASEVDIEFENSGGLAALESFAAKVMREVASR